MTRPIAKDVNNMFASIAKRYDLANYILSLGLHKSWQSKALSLLPINKNLKCLDLCTGTGALLGDLCKKYDQVVGADFCLEMLEIAKDEFQEQVNQGLKLDLEDALNLSYKDNSFDIITVAYGVRNFENLEKGLKEINRVLSDKGIVLIIEFGQVTGIVKPFFLLYSKFIMPLIGKIVTGNLDAYKYLPQTVNKFPCGKEFEQILIKNNFKISKIIKLFFGQTYIYLAEKR